MSKYKESNKRATLMNDKVWVETINDLKLLKIDNENKEYTVIYKEKEQRKNREFQFHKVDFVSDTNSFIFTSFVERGEDGSLTHEVEDREVLMDIEIVNFKIEDKEDVSGYCFF